MVTNIVSKILLHKCLHSSKNKSKLSSRKDIHQVTHNFESYSKFTFFKNIEQLMESVSDIKQYRSIWSCDVCYLLLDKN